MELKELQDLLDRYGGDPLAWPADRRPDALVLARTSPEAFRLLRDTCEVERVLAGDEAPEPDMRAIDQVMDRIQAHEEAVAVAAAEAEAAIEIPRPTMWDEIRSVLGGFVYRPLLLITMASLIGVIVGVADRTMSLRETHSGLMYFIMTL